MSLPEKHKFGGQGLSFAEGTFVRVQDLSFYRTGFVGLGDVCRRDEIDNKAMTAAQLLQKFGVKLEDFERSVWTEPEKDDDNPDLNSVKNAENSKK